MKIALCNSCVLYAHNSNLVCAVHPDGVNENHCLDFRQDPDKKEQIIEEIWSPEGYTFYDGELTPLKPSRYTVEEKLEILDTHPFFTGKCPECGYEFDPSNLPQVHWDCPECGWLDDSV